MRLASWPWVFGGPEPRIVGDGDVLYQVMQAGRLVAGGLGAVWRDPGLNYPLGADVPWPPLFASLIAGAGWFAGGWGAPDAQALLAAALWVPAILGLLGVLVTAWLGRALLGGRPWLDAALILALLPSHALLTILGRADQHALEPILFALMLLAAARLARAGGAGAAALLAAAAALAFWNWNGSVLYLAILAAFAASWHALAAPGDEAPGRAAGWMALGFLGGALLLAISVALLAPAGALGGAGLSGLTGLQPALLAGTALGCALLAAARRLRPAARGAERIAAAAAALLVPPAVLLAIPWTRDGLLHGLTMLAASGWYRTIIEFRPILPSGSAPLSVDLSKVLGLHGLTPLAVAAALPLLWRRWRRGPEAERGPVLLAGVAAAATLVMGWARARFSVYLSLTEAIGLAFVAREAAAAVAARWPSRTAAGPAVGVAVALLAVAPILPTLPGADWAPFTPERYSDFAPLGRLAGRLWSPPGREAVLAPWSWGHDVRFWSGRPVVSSPFGIEGGAGALEVDAAFHRTVSQAEAEGLLAKRRVGFVLVTEPLDEVVSLDAFAPPGAPRVFKPGSDPGLLSQVTVSPAFSMLVAARLWLWDGMWGDVDGRLLAEGRAALDAFRLLGEGPSNSVWQAVGVPTFKLFQVVPGAQVAVRGAAPGALVEARTSLRMPTGRAEDWVTWARAGDDGVARFRLPYATGLNGAVQASPWRLGDGRGATGVAPTEQAVLLGEAIEVKLSR